MPTPIQKLHLEDCLEDTPQTRTFIDVFEKDALMLKKFSKAFLSSCQKMLNAQAMMISATQELSYYLRLYGKQNFPLDITNEKEDENDDSIATNLNQFANYIDEISTCFQVFVTQLNDTMIYPMNRLIDSEFDELNSLSQMYQIASDEVDQAMQKYLRVPNKKEYDQQRQQLNEEVYAFKKKFHQTALNYFNFLNSLQHKRKFMFTEPMLSCLHSLKLYFKMGSETFNTNSSSTIDEFVSKISNSVCEIKEHMSEEVNKSNQMIELLQQDDSIYYAENPNAEETIEPISDNIVQKSGYLNLRSKFPFISKWDRSFYFIQNGYLMQQGKNEIAGYPFMELKADLSASLCEIDDRKFTFQVISQFPKKITYFQANTKRDCEEWIKILENAIKDENKTKLQNHMNNLHILSNKSKSSSPPASNKAGKHENLKVNFELEASVNDKRKMNAIAKPQQGDSFKVRFLGSMLVKSDKGNEYINETIRQVMATRAEQNVFKLSEFNLVVNMESLNLFKVPSAEAASTDSTTSQPISSLNNEEDLLLTQFDLADLAFWSMHRENERLFGFIIKEKNFKFSCHVFESDINSTKICEAITKATQSAYQLLVDENKSEHFKKIKKTEKDILLQNISCLPDKVNVGKNDKNQEEIDNENEEFINAAQMAFNSPNPNFIVLDRELLENLNTETETYQTKESSTQEKNGENKATSNMNKNVEVSSLAESASTENTKEKESDA